MEYVNRRFCVKVVEPNWYGNPYTDWHYFHTETAAREFINARSGGSSHYTLIDNDTKIPSQTVEE
jgi:hypothetical protein